MRLGSVGVLAFTAAAFTAATARAAGPDRAVYHVDGLVALAGFSEYGDDEGCRHDDLEEQTFTQVDIKATNELTREGGPAGSSGSSGFLFLSLFRKNFCTGEVLAHISDEVIPIPATSLVVDRRLRGATLSTGVVEVYNTYGGGDMIPVELDLSWTGFPPAVATRSVTYSRSPHGSSLYRSTTADQVVDARVVGTVSLDGQVISPLVPEFAELQSTRKATITVRRY